MSNFYSHDNFYILTHPQIADEIFLTFSLNIYTLTIQWKEPQTLSYVLVFTNCQIVYKNGLRNFANYFKYCQFNKIKISLLAQQYTQHIHI